MYATNSGKCARAVSIIPMDGAAEANTGRIPAGIANQSRKE
jgi:hypothetical protein